MVNPSMPYSEFKEFSRLARSATLVPVVKSVSADLLTPVSAFLAIAEKEPHAFLLESVERGEQIGRYTFLGARPYMRLRARGSARSRSNADGAASGDEGNVFQVVKELLGEHRPAGDAGAAAVHRRGRRLFFLRRGAATGKDWRAREERSFFAGLRIDVLRPVAGF